MKNRALITGGAGFIGSHVAERLLKEGHEVYVYDLFPAGEKGHLPPGAIAVEGDIRDAERVMKIFLEIRPQWVSHQAAQISVGRSTREPRLDAEINILGTINLLEASSHSGVERFVFASSGGAIYGETAQPASEETVPIPKSPYAIAKLAGEAYGKLYFRERGLPFLGLRYANIYGPRQNAKGEAAVIPTFITRLMRQEPCMIHGDGLHSRDLVFAEDVAEANLVALTSDLAGDIYNIASGEEVTVKQLHALLRGILGVKGEPLYGTAKAFDIRSSTLDPEKTRRLLGWSARTSLEDGLRRTVEWFQGQEEAQMRLRAPGA